MHTGPPTWTLIQIVIDCLLILLIVFFLIVLLRERKQRAFLREWILKQTRVFTDLVHTSDQKTETLSQTVEELIRRLRREISAAQKVLETLERVPESQRGPSVTPGTRRPKTGVERPPSEREAIRYLLKKGMKPLEISKQLNVPIGEVELVSKLESNPPERL